MNSRPALVLASSSPRRADLLTTIGATFTVRPAAVDESRREGEPAHEHVARLARAKAAAVAAPGTVVIAADTVVVVDDEVLGKPADADEARAMLRRLSGRAHEVLTGLAVASAGPTEGPVIHDAVVSTHVWFTELSDAVIDWYVGTGEPLDKAGAYGIQGIAGMFVQYLHGSYQNVVGLPLADLAELMEDAGHPLLGWVG